MFSPPCWARSGSFQLSTYDVNGPTTMKRAVPIYRAIGPMSGCNCKDHMCPN